MAVSSRSARQFSGHFQNKLENLGSDQMGDQFAAFRASFHQASGNGTGGPLATVSTPLTAHDVGTVAVANGIEPNAGVQAGQLFQFTELGFGDNPYFVTSANLAAIGANTDVGAWSKLQYGLAEIFIESQMAVRDVTLGDRDAALSSFTSLNGGALISGGYVAIDAISNNGDGAALLAQLEALGLERGAAFGNLAGGLIPIDRLDELAGLSLLGFARPVYAETNVGSVMSQNVAAMNVDYLHSTYGLTGSGITIGFLSDSFNTATLTTGGTALSVHYTQDIASGDLPNNVNILADASATTVRDEGRAMAQLAYDIAPGATLMFHTAFISMADFAQGIVDLYNAGARIIVDDVRYFNEPFFQDGIIAQAVNQVTAGGAMYFSSAGNQGTASYTSEFRHSGQFITLPDGVTYEYHDFDPGAGVDTLQSISRAGTVTYTLNWDQPNFSVSGGAGSQSNMAWLLVNSAGGGSFTSTNNVGGDAIEVAQSAGAFVNVALLLRVGDAAPDRMQYVLSGSVAINEYATNSGTSFGHSNADGAISVGAADWIDTPRFAAPSIAGEPLPYLETFSSRGDIPILFDQAGNRLAAPEWRSTVDFTASDGGNNTFFGGDASYDADTLPNFYGTSAAAPNAAAIAALLMSAFPTATRAQIEIALERSALDIQVTYTGTQVGDGYDNRSGYGLIQADRAYTILAAMLDANFTNAAGDIAIIAYNTGQTDGSGSTADALRFVATSDIAAGTVIFFTDRAWNGTAFAAAAGSDGTATYTVGVGGLAAGSTVNLTGAALGTLNPEEAGDTIYAYTGSIDAPQHFLFAIDLADGNSTFNGNLANTGLVDGVSAVAVSLDSASYQGPTTEAGAYRFNGESLVQNIADNGNWLGDDLDGQKALDQPDHIGPYGTAPDLAIWTGGAGGGGGIFNVSVDATVDSGNTGFNLNQLYTNLTSGGNNVFYGIRDVVFDTAHGKFFVADSDLAGHNRVLQGNISDLMGNPGSIPTLTTLYSDPGSGTATRIFNLEVDKANGIVYFDHGETLMKVNYDTASQAGVQLAQLGGTGSGNPTGTANSGFVDDFQIDFATGTVYFSAHRVVAAADGDIVSRNYIGKITGLDAGDGAGAFSWGNGAITLLPFSPDDDDAGTLFNSGEQFPQELGTVEGIAISPDGLTLYIVTAKTLYDNDADGGVAGGPGTPPLLTPGGIYAYALTGNPTGTYTTVYQPTDDGNDGSAAINLANGPQGLLDDIEIDPVTGRLYFMDTTGDQLSPVSNPPGDEGIWAINPNGTGISFVQALFNINGLGATSLFLNRAPTLSATNNAATVTEATNAIGSGQTAGADLFSGISLADADTLDGSDELAGATVRISANFQAGASHQDVLLINGTTSGTIAGSGITYSYNSTTGVMLLSGAATTAEYQAAIDLINFATSGDNITNYGQAGTRTIAVSVFDGMLNSDEKTTNVTVVGINDAPATTVPGAQSASEDVGKVITGIVVSDVDADPATQDITVTLHVSHGTLSVFTNVGNGIELADVTGNGTATVTITATQNQINATFAAANGLTYLNTLDFNGADTLVITTNDGGLNGNDPGATGGGTNEEDQDNIAINIAAVNDAPVVIGDGTEDSLTIFEDQPSSAGQTVNTLFAGQYSDQKDDQIPNGGLSSPGAFSGVAVIANGSSAGTGNWQYEVSPGVWQDIGARTPTNALLISNTTALRFNPAADYNGPEPQLTVRLIDNSFGAGINFQVVDLSAGSAYGGTTPFSTGTVTLGGTVLAVNDAPTGTNLAGDIATYIEGGAPVALDVGGNVTIADIDSANFDTGTLTVHIANPVAAQDQLSIVPSATITIAGNAVLFNSVQFATFTGGGAGAGDLVFTFDPDATPAAVQALIQAIAYSNSDANDPTSGARNIVWTLVDGDGNANNGTDTLTVNSSVNVLGVNDEPSGQDGSITLNEDAVLVFSQGDFQFSDTDGDNFAGVVITTVPTNGTLTLNNVAVTDGQFISAADIAANLLVFHPDQDENGTPYASFTFQVRDDGGIDNGGQDTDQSPNTYTFNYTPVNDAPTSANLAGDAAVYVEGSAPITLDVGANATIADVDTADFAGGSLHVTMTNGLNAEDVLAVADQGTGPGQIGYSNGTVTYEGVTIAHLLPTLGFPTPFLDIHFDAGAVSQAAVEALIHAITYTNTGGISPTTGTRNVTWEFYDGDLGPAGILNIASTVDVQAINDAPTGTSAAVTINEDATFTFVAGNFGFGDVNGDDFAGVVVTTIPVPGTLFYDADGVGVGAAAVAVTAGQFISAADIGLGKLFYTPVADGNGVPFSSFTFQVRDDGGTGNGGQDTDQSPNTFTFNVTALNDAPSITLGSTSVGIPEDASFTFSGPNAFTVADVDASVLTVTLTVSHGTLTLSGISGLSFGAGDGTNDATMTFTGSAASINTALSGLLYAPTANFNGNDALTIQVSDNGQTGTGGVQMDTDAIPIAVSSVNDAPAGTDNTVTGSEDDPYVFTAADFGFTDPNDVPADGFNAISIITFPANGTLFLDVDGPGGAAPIDLSTVGPTVFVGIADINAGHLYFQPDPDEYGDGYASFTFKVQDDGGIIGGGVDLDPVANTITIDVEPDNLRPVVDLNGAGGGVDYSTTFVEDGAAVAIGSGITVADQDLIPSGGAITGATVTLTDRVAGDSLAFNAPLPPGFTAVITNLVGSITIEISGTGTGADYQAILASIVYATTSQDPTVGGTDLARTITVTVDDGGLDSLVATSTINITAIDDLPVAQADAFTITESGTISAGNLFADNGSGADTDPDGPPLAISAVNGSGANVGTQILLGSGALLTVNANGTFDYDPNGAFLPTPTAGSGASNTPSHDGFSYTLAGGNTVNVSITLTGLDTDDLLLGTAGTDILMGGTGNDTYFVENATDQVLEAAGAGFDAVYASVSYTLGAGQEIEWLSTANVSGTDPLNLTGNAFAQYIFGNEGTNILNGGGGLDILVGLGGNDTYMINGGGGATVQEAVGGGFDAIYTSANYALTAGQEVEWLSAANNASTAALSLTGNEFTNFILGTAGGDVINGGAGADFLYGLGGNDTYYVDNAGDQVFEAAAGGFDALYTNTSYTLLAGQEVEWLSTADTGATNAINLTGNEFANFIFGNAGNNIISGGGGADLLYGLGGNDTYNVSSSDTQVFEAAGGGNDAVFAFTSFALGAGQEIEFLQAANPSQTAAINLTGNELANTIYGNAGANVLDGKGGNDSLVGLGGADTFAFTTALGAGNVDVVFGFEHGIDKIALDDAIFTAAGGLGALNSNAFVVGAAAADASDRIIYNNLTGQLFYDADGIGGVAAVQFATLNPGLTLTASDFQVI